ncbi:MAG: sodium:proton antiporter NhaD [Methylovulum sp.]|uniref:sodium:proton antiporter NhaD n=1 Tax=Methylovulum sp. TaxID=1916980 RepID=UPI0026059F99|nr:sodium:proton antiporter NhaD [Methylovulum sp.]MDD2722649.1 sodium:proton antiporter NhaD [Methylovulum sp.]MDD5123879.1 sodium:proton antiporter NhaD [Methylovulum sp.]
MNFILLSLAVLFLPGMAIADDVVANAPGNLDLTHHVIGYLSLLVTVAAYIAAMSEEVTELRKSKPMVLGSALVWLAICIYYALHGDAKTAALAFESNLLAYIELLLFILVSMTYLNTMEERGVFNGLKVYLLSRKFSYRRLFWITGALAFVLSTIINGLTIGLLMGSIALAVGKKKPEFVALACVNIVIATNAGGAFSPLGGISTLFVWQRKILHFTEFFSLAIPCLVNFLVPACVMHFWVPKETPEALNEKIVLKRGSKRIIFLFILTLAITVSANVLLELPPAAGMMAGLGLLQFFNFYLTKTAHIQESDFAYVYRFYHLEVPKANNNRTFDVFKNVGNVDWDTLLFFYGAMMIIGAISFVGYLDAVAQFLFGQISPTLANIMIGLSSAFVDNGTLMFAVLNMHSNLPPGQWLLLTLTLGVGGSLLAIGSAPGVGMLGHIKGHYTFTAHLRWMPMILLGYFASVAVHFWINARYF